ncbi:hypothetical protein Ctob_015446 [Chrysochromulina tobinii]|uniref:Uncharacterized protein n=1 Tax=Chrysochromulina tobinii TaxID=1460289 RepID=A0A0M0K942_9EUKA|nr:hypothetical protein Ctob_015446 [Chrysochromulina tobinii]|eukprot:KOO35107.1 hypothetical protein Ctob_015446 [Chrysochromulina sp. CCMP291]
MISLVTSLLLGAPVDNVIKTMDTGVIDLHGASKAQVLVIVADHGSGTSTFGEALNKHPCLFDVGEPFGDSYLVWTSSKIPECHGTTPEATFDADSHHLLHESNAKLSTHLANVVKHLGVSHIDSGELYRGLHYDLSEFFVRIRDLVCKDVPADVCPAADCAIALKMFPQFVDAHTAGVRVKADLAGNPCHDAMNKKAMVAWKEALESFKHNSKVIATDCH